MQNRRQVIKAALAGTVTAGLAAVVPVDLFASKQKSNIAGWNADGLSKPVLDIAQQWAIEAGNPILALQPTQVAIHQAAMAYRLTNEHLDSLGFYKAASQHLFLHKELLTYNDSAVERQYQAIVAAGLNLDRSRHIEFVKMGYDHPKAVLKVAQYVHKHGAANFHRLAIGKMRQTAQFASPTGFSVEAIPRFKRMQESSDYGTWDYSGDFGDFMWDASPPMSPGRWFNDRQCTYIDWALAYISVVGIAAPGIGEGIAVGALIGWAITKIGGC